MRTTSTAGGKKTRITAMTRLTSLLVVVWICLWLCIQYLSNSTTSSQASKLHQSKTLPTDVLTGVKCRATSVAKNVNK